MRLPTGREFVLLLLAAAVLAALVLVLSTPEERAPLWMRLFRVEGD